MSGWICWLLADESDAGAIAAVARPPCPSFQRWPHLLLDDVNEMQMWYLIGIVGSAGESLPTLVDDRGEGFMHSVYRVLPDFIAALAAMKETAILETAAIWARCEAMEGWTVHDAALRLGKLSDFARRGSGASKPVLTLAAW